MNKLEMTQLTYSLISFFTTFASCNGQNNSKAIHGRIEIEATTSLIDQTIQVIHQDKKSNYWFGSNENEVLHIRSVLADSKGRIWIGNNWIGVLLKEGETTINFSEKHNLIHPTSTRRGGKSKPDTLEHVFAIEEDSEGNIWFGDRDTGVWKYDGKNVTNYIIDNKFSDPMIWTIYKANNNSLPFGMAEGKIYKLNGKSFEKLF